MLAELLVPIFLPGIAFLAVLLVLKPEQRGRWSGLVGGFVLPLATLVGFAYEGAWPSSFSDWHRLPLILGGAGLLSAGLCWLPSGVRGWFAPLTLGALAGFLVRFQIWKFRTNVFWASVLWSPSNGGCWPLKPRWAAWLDLARGFLALPSPRWPLMGDSRRS